MNDTLNADELDLVEFAAGRGYKAEQVDRFRVAAVAAIRRLERRVSEMELVVDTLRSDAVSRGPQVDLVVLLTQADPDQVTAAGATAAGRILRLAVDGASTHWATTRSQLAVERNRVAASLERAIDVARDGRRPEYELHTLVIEASRALESLRLAGLAD